MGIRNNKGMRTVPTPLALQDSYMGEKAVLCLKDGITRDQLEQDEALESTREFAVHRS